MRVFVDLSTLLEMLYNNRVVPKKRVDLAKQNTGQNSHVTESNVSEIKLLGDEN